ncbi:hypothetical protein GF324_09670 [bacterium]|nr:hypothetical protein [bacterium]
MKAKSVLAVLLTAVLVIGGCAGGSKVQKTEPGYQPTHIVIGKITPNTMGDSRMDAGDVKRMFHNNLEGGLRQEKVKFVTEKEAEEGMVEQSKIVRLDALVFFEKGARAQSLRSESSTEVRVTWQLHRYTDDLLFAKGSARSTDVTASRGATTDLRTAIQNGARATVMKAGEALK